MTQTGSAGDGNSHGRSGFFRFSTRSSAVSSCAASRGISSARSRTGVTLMA
uniref:Uncharacterized protein n=1 Tax=Faecalibaculum rodentium TaxID=1702221 RepID=A0A140DRD3_9FIRM|nr:hypothetical protein AALO17_00760 [Faecalibaculum rodentium]